MSISGLLLKPLLLGTCVTGPSGQGLEYVLNASPRLVALDPTVPPSPFPMAEASAPTFQPAGWAPSTYVGISQSPHPMWFPSSEMSSAFPLLWTLF